MAFLQSLEWVIDKTERRHHQSEIELTRPKGQLLCDRANDRDPTQTRDPAHRFRRLHACRDVERLRKSSRTDADLYSHRTLRNPATNRIQFRLVGTRLGLKPPIVVLGIFVERTQIGILNTFAPSTNSRR